MRILNFIVNQQVLRRDPDCDFSNLISGTSGYLYAQFSFSSDWNDSIKIVEFIDNDAVYPVKLSDSDTMCEIPSEALTSSCFNIRIIGRSDDKNILTNTISIGQRIGSDNSPSTEELLNENERSISTFSLFASDESRIADYIEEEHIIVDSNRFITVPEKLKRIAVQTDHNIETVTFDCPRYWDGIDLSTMRVYINYMRADGFANQYLCDNVIIDEIDDTIMHFDWIISGDVTAVKGSVSFIVCIKETNEEGNEERHWNSEVCRDIRVSEGLECEEVVLSEFPDIIGDLLNRMAKAELAQGVVDGNLILDFKRELEEQILALETVNDNWGEYRRWNYHIEDALSIDVNSSKSDLHRPSFLFSDSINTPDNLLYAKRDITWLNPQCIDVVLDGFSNSGNHCIWFNHWNGTSWSGWQVFDNSYNHITKSGTWSYSGTTGNSIQGGYTFNIYRKGNVLAIRGSLYTNGAIGGELNGDQSTRKICTIPLSDLGINGNVVTTQEIVFDNEHNNKTINRNTCWLWTVESEASSLNVSIAPWGNGVWDWTGIVPLNLTTIVV